MRLSELRNKSVRTLDGERLGRVHELHCEKGKIIALMIGPGGFLESLTAKKSGRRIPWQCVVRVEPRQVVVNSNPPQRKTAPKGANASRSRQRTRRPSAPRSKR